MKNRVFSMINGRGQSYLVQANSPEVAIIKAGRMGDLGWHIIDEFSDEQYCYITLKRALSKEYNDLTNELYRYFKSRMRDLYFDAYCHLENIENIIGIREHDEVVRYVVDNY